MKDFMKYDFDIEKVVLACRVKKGHGDRIHNDRASHGIAVHIGGEKLYRYKSGETYITKQNTVNYMPRGSSYVVDSIEPGECYAINFELSSDVSFHPFTVTIKNAAPIIEQFRNAAKLWSRKGDSYGLGCKAALCTILYMLQNDFSRDYIDSDGLNTIRPAVDAIHKGYCDPDLSVTELARLCGITPEYFRKLFARAHGSSPLRYINRLRFERARELIESGMYSVTEAALSSGFSDMSYFSRAFKREFGIPPSKILSK